MPILICPGCQARVEIPEGTKAKLARCLRCEHIINLNEEPKANTAFMAPRKPLSIGPVPDSHSSTKVDIPLEDNSPQPKPSVSLAQPVKTLDLPHMEEESPKTPSVVTEPTPKRRQAILGPVMIPRQLAPPFPVTGLLLFGASILLGVVLIAVGVWWMREGSIAHPHLVYLPDKSDFLISVKVNEVLETVSWKKMSEQFPEFKKNMEDLDKDIPLKEVKTLIVGGRNAGNEMIVLITTKEKYSEGKLREKFNLGREEPTPIGRYRLHRLPGGRAVSLVEPNLVLVGRRESMKQILARGGKPLLEEKIHNALADVDFSKPLAGVVDARVVPRKQAPGGMFPGTMGVHIYSFEIDIGDKLSGTIRGYCSDPMHAEQARISVETNLEMLRFRQVPGLAHEVADLLAGMRLSTEGSQVICQLTVEVDQLASLKEKINKARAPLLGGLADQVKKINAALPKIKRRVNPPTVFKEGPETWRTFIEPHQELTYDLQTSDNVRCFVTVEGSGTAPIDVRLQDQDKKIIAMDQDRSNKALLVWKTEKKCLYRLVIRNRDARKGNELAITFRESRYGLIPPLPKPEFSVLHPVPGRWTISLKAEDSLTFTILVPNKKRTTLQVRNLAKNKAPNADVNIAIYDLAGQRIIVDDSPRGDAMVGFTPNLTQQYHVVIYNLGPQAGRWEVIAN